MSKFANVEGLAARVFELREGGAKWDAAGGIVETVRGEFEPLKGLKSAIPLRTLYKAELARRNADARLKATKASVTAARDKGEGWESIAARAGKTVAEVKGLYDETKGLAGTKGRAYVSADGTLNVKLEATSKKKVEPVFGADLVAEALAELKAEADGETNDVALAGAGADAK